MTRDADFGRTWNYIARSSNGEDLGGWSGAADDEAIAYFASEYISADVQTVKVYRLTRDGGEEYVGQADRTRLA